MLLLLLACCLTGATFALPLILALRRVTGD